MPSPPSLERQVAGALRRAGFSLNELTLAGTTLVVACSGGPDSTALLRCLHQLRTTHNLSLHVAHLNHDFRGAEADHDAAFVQRLADGLGLPCSIDKRDPIAYQRARGISSFEQAAREMRYSFLAAVAGNVGANGVALGHTSDDQAETILLHVLRGAGLNGLRGMAEVAAWPWPGPTPGPLLFRPLLGVGKADTAVYCRELGQTYRQDSGNYMWRFTRNKLRLDLMPRLARDYNPRVREALLRLSRAAADEADYIGSELDRHWPGIASESDGAIRLDAVALRSLHPALQRQALRQAYACAAGDARALSENHLDAMLSLLRNGKGGRAIHLPRGIMARLEAGLLNVGRACALIATSQLTRDHTIHLPSGRDDIHSADIESWRLSFLPVEQPERPESTGSANPPFCATLRRDVLGDTVIVRARRPGDRFQPAGMSGTKKLQDFFTDAKVPRSDRDNIPLLLCDRGIAWVAGHRVADWALPSEDARSVQVNLSLIK